MRALQASLASLAAAGLLILFGHSLQSPPMMVMTLLVLVNGQGELVEGDGEHTPSP